MTEQDQEPDLPPRSTLDTWTVPQLPDDFADRVVEAWHGELARGRPADPPLVEPSPAWRRWGIAAVAAALAAAAVLVWWTRPVAPQSYVPTVVQVTTPAPATVVSRPPQVAAPVPIPPLPEPDAKDLHVTVEVQPPDATLRLLRDEQEVGRGVAGATFTLQPIDGARYIVEASADGYVTQRTGIDFRGNEATLRLELARMPTVEPSGPTVRDKDAGPPSTPPQAKNCIVRIGTSRGASPAKVKVDGKLIGTTPIASYKVTCGRHEVTWEWANGRTLTETVVMSDGESRTLKRG